MAFNKNAADSEYSNAELSQMPINVSANPGSSSSNKPTSMNQGRETGIAPKWDLLVKDNVAGADGDGSDEGDVGSTRQTQLVQGSVNIKELN